MDFPTKNKHIRSEAARGSQTPEYTSKGAVLGPSALARARGATRGARARHLTVDPPKTTTFGGGEGGLAPPGSACVLQQQGGRNREEPWTAANSAVTSNPFCRLAAHPVLIDLSPI